jgi:hypothetical protein
MSRLEPSGGNVGIRVNRTRDAEPVHADRPSRAGFPDFFGFRPGLLPLSISGWPEAASRASCLCLGGLLSLSRLRVRLMTYRVLPQLTHNRAACRTITKHRYGRDSKTFHLMVRLVGMRQMLVFQASVRLLSAENRPSHWIMSTFGERNVWHGSCLNILSKSKQLGSWAGT